MKARSPIARPISARSPLARAIGAVARAFTPAVLFRDGQQGVWYEPKPTISGQQILYQDAAGTTPVTADGDPVGLMLDLHEGLKLGPESITNGEFNDGATGWNVSGEDGTHIVTFSDGTMRYQSDTTSPILVVSQGDALELGKFYEIVVNVSSYVSGSLKTDSAVEDNVEIATGAGENRLIIQSNTSTFTILRNSPNVDITVDSASIKELPGNHATQSTSAARPLNRDVAPLQEYDDVDDEMDVSLPSIASATVATATPTGAVIQYPVDLSSGIYTITESHSGIVILDRELTAAESANLTDYLNNLAGV